MGLISPYRPQALIKQFLLEGGVKNVSATISNNSKNTIRLLAFHIETK